jgi:hypothetical protein
VASILLECGETDENVLKYHRGRFLSTIITPKLSSNYHSGIILLAAIKTGSRRQMRSETRVTRLAHREHATEGQTINEHFYLRVLRSVRDALRRKRWQKWELSMRQSHNDNATTNSVKFVQRNKVLYKRGSLPAHQI